MKRKIDRSNTSSILQVALDVHMTTMGSYERSEETQKVDIAFLKERLANWERTGHMV